MFCDSIDDLVKITIKDGLDKHVNYSEEYKEQLIYTLQLINTLSYNAAITIHVACHMPRLLIK